MALRLLPFRKATVRQLCEGAEIGSTKVEVWHLIRHLASTYVKSPTEQLPLTETNIH